jgi:hypothetical protein
MKKFFIVMAAVVTLSLVSCENNDYKAKGEQLAKQLDELCQKQDANAVLELDESIRNIEKEIADKGDSTAVVDFRNALKEARARNAAYISKIKVQNGQDAEATVQDVVQDALEGDVDINAVSASIDSLLELQKNSKNKK